MPDFGWNYPPGAANDPRAPYNQIEEDEEDEDGEPLTHEKQTEPEPDDDDWDDGDIPL